MNRTSQFACLSVLLFFAGCAVRPEASSGPRIHPAVFHAITAVASPHEIPSEPNPDLDRMLSEEEDHGNLMAARRRDGAQVPGYRVRGDVPRSGRYILKDMMTVAEAIQAAGSAQPDSSSKLIVTINRNGVHASFDPFEHEHYRLKNGDVIDVKSFRPAPQGVQKKERESNNRMDGTSQ